MFHYYPYFLHPGTGELLYGGMTLGPFIGGLLTQFFGWRSIFFITVLLGCVVLFFVRRFPRLLDEKRRDVFVTRA